MNIVAEECQSEKHHPDWRNVRLPLLEYLTNFIYEINNSDDLEIQNRYNSMEHRQAQWPNNERHPHG